jgi:hypothetical protein
MPDSICMSDCFYQDEQGRIALRLDNETIKCEQDSTGNSRLVATGGLADCTPWPHACAPSLYGQPIYCDADGKLYAGLKPYYKSGSQGSYSLIPDLGTLMQGTGQVLRTATSTFLNDDTCGRNVELNIDFLFNGFNFTVPASKGLWLLPQISFDGIQWISIQGIGIINHSAVQYNMVESAFSWKERKTVAPGQSVTMGMRWMTGNSGQGHSTGETFNSTSESLYGFQLYWDARGI